VSVLALDPSTTQRQQLASSGTLPTKDALVQCLRLKRPPVDPRVHQHQVVPVD
jgi:hypothetical protein